MIAHIIGALILMAAGFAFAWAISHLIDSIGFDVLYDLQQWWRNGR